jgi:hypothetical protein
MTVSTGEAMPPGTGPIAYLHFTVYDTGWAVVDTAVSSTVLWLYFVDIQSHYWTPEVTPTPSEYHIQHYCEVGDVNCDGIINVGDVVFLVNYLYRSGPPPDTPGRGDVNGDGDVNVGDVIYLTNFLYRSGPAPRG